MEIVSTLIFRNPNLWCSIDSDLINDTTLYKKVKYDRDQIFKSNLYHEQYVNIPTFELKVHEKQKMKSENVSNKVQLIALSDQLLQMAD